MLLRSIADEVVRVVVGALAAGVPEFANGDGALAIPFPFAFALRKGEGVRPEGVPDREMGGVGLLIAGLSQEEKKSSSGSPAGVELPSVAAAPSVITTSLGYLLPH